MKLATIDLDDPVHYADFGGTGAPLVLIHGLGGSLTNWLAVAEGLTSRFRVFAPDLIGFGRTPLAGRKPGIPEQSAMLARFLEHVGGGPAVVVGNSMGGLVAVQLAADHPALVSRIILVSAALPRELGTRVDGTVALMFALYMTPFLGEAVLRRRAAAMGPEGVLRDTMRLCGVDPDALPAHTIDRSVALIEGREDVPAMDKAFLDAARSLLRLLIDPRRYRQAMESIQAPVLLVQGDEDRLVPAAAARDVAARLPHWQYLELPGVGHVPQLQVPDQVATEVLAWLAATAEARTNS